MKPTNLIIGISIAALAGGFLLFGVDKSLSSEPSEANKTTTLDRALVTRQEINHAYGDAAQLTDVSMSRTIETDAPSRTVSSPTLGQRTSLWITRKNKASRGELPVEYIQADPTAIAYLSAGEPIEIHIPQTGRTFDGVVESVSSPVPGVSTVDISFVGLNDIFHMQMHRGASTTHGWAATPEGIFNLEIDAITGQGKVISDAETIARWPLEHDIVRVTVEEPNGPSQSSM